MSIAAARDAMAARLGVAAWDLQTEDERSLDLLSKGVIVRLRIKAWPATARLEPSDLGLPGSARLADDPFRLGRKILLPARLHAEQNGLVRACREALYAHAIETAWGRFVPATAFDAYRAALETEVDRLYAFSQRLADTYDTWTAGVRAMYEGVALRARLRAAQLDPASVPDPAAFEERFLDAVLSQIPNRPTLATLYRVEQDLQFIPLQAYLEAKLPDAARDDAEARVQRAVLEAAAARKGEYLDGFLRDVSAHLRQMVYEVAGGLTASLAGQNTLTARKAERLRELVARLASMNVADDNEIAEAVARIEALLDRATVGKPAPDLAGALRDLAATARAELLDLGVAPRAERDLGEAPEDVGPADAVRAPRLLAPDDAATIIPLPARRARAL